MSQSYIYLLSAITATFFFYSQPALADEDQTGPVNVIEQKPYSTNSFPENTIVFNTEKHGNGTFYVHRPYRQYNRSVKYPRSQHPDVRQHYPSTRIYTQPQPVVTYYYSAPIGNHGHIRIESSPGLHARYGRGHQNSRNASPNYHRHPAQQVRQYNYYPRHYSSPYPQRSHQRNVINRSQQLPQCLGPNCGK